MNRLFLTPALLLSLLAGCSQEVPHVAPQPAPIVASATQAPAVAAADGGVATGQDVGTDLMSIDFVDKPSCASGEAATVSVKWDVGPLGITSVAMFVESPANPKKLWMEAGGNGEGTTGKWVYDQTRFTLQEKASGKVLASRLLERPCVP